MIVYFQVADLTPIARWRLYQTATVVRIVHFEYILYDSLDKGKGLDMWNMPYITVFVLVGHLKRIFMHLL